MLVSSKSSRRRCRLPDRRFPKSTQPRPRSASRFPRRSAGARVAAGRIEVRGVAWTGLGHVTGVEVAASPGGPWRPATFLTDARPYTWRLWPAALDSVRPGRLQIRARATDSSGDTQPDLTPWNKSGYLWNGIDTVECEVA